MTLTETLSVTRERLLVREWCGEQNRASKGQLQGLEEKIGMIEEVTEDGRMKKEREGVGAVFSPRGRHAWIWRAAGPCGKALEQRSRAELLPAGLLCAMPLDRDMRSSCDQQPRRPRLSRSPRARTCWRHCMGASSPQSRRRNGAALGWRRAESRD